ncbi:MAG: hypothetical protein QOK05_1586 [Chloroflexota bacterium]|jgi:hypothetical protein|nr:hypothetical protein [Chloroflexota bacterium]
MPNHEHKIRQDLRAAALRRLSRLKFTAVTVSTLAFGGLSASIASQPTVSRTLATSAISSTQAVASPSASAAAAGTAAPAIAPTAAATQAPVAKAPVVARTIVSAQS